MTDNPHTGPVHQPGHRHWSTHTRPRAPKRTEPHRLAFSAPNSVRRPASASRTYGRCAVDPPGRSLTRRLPAARPTAGEEAPERRSTTRTTGLTDPAPSGALLLFLWVRFGGAAQGAGPLLPGQGRLRRRGARALRAPLDLRASAAPSGRACGQAWGLPGKGCAAPPNLARAGGPPAKILE